jgi:hypothetical protein
MVLALFTLTAALLAYLACTRPEWFLPAFIAFPTILEVIIIASGGDASLIAAGPVTLRMVDPSALALLFGIMYHSYNHRPGRHLWRGAKLFTILIAVFLGVKVVLAVLSGSLGDTDVVANAVANKLGWGGVAALGEVRDDFLSLLVPLYVVVCGNRLKLYRLLTPMLVAMIIIVLKAVINIAMSGQVWSSDGRFRYITADEAVTLTIFALCIFLLLKRGGGTRIKQGFAIACFLLALLANHRSQWLAASLGCAVLLLVLASGKWSPFRNRTTGEVLRVVVALAMLGAIGAASLLSIHRGVTDISGTSGRLTAFTDPERDPTASWRLRLWTDRLEQSREHIILGRQLGDRRPSLIDGAWLYVPNHNAYVTAIELGGISLLTIVVIFWGSLVLDALRQLKGAARHSRYNAPAVALAVSVASLSFATAYDFPLLGPAVALLLLLPECREAPPMPVGMSCFQQHWVMRAPRSGLLPVPSQVSLNRSRRHPAI